ncbi:hypothetical protein BAMA_21315 [Bacillus manliponensis]|uniref:Polymerase beta nucleotidyltransferase domain-containing protein n=1 Tax=Bacillus manliponensis TaxID=574376 RepID=A0A073KBV4_9BACI|nr:hypothetical protein BAMA_21315 [Bacillus manliponensis]
MDFSLKTKIINYFIRNYNCHSIILFGPHAREDVTHESDIDVVCFTDQLISSSNDTKIFGRKRLDAWIYETKKMRDIDEFLRIRRGKILYDNRKICEKFLIDINGLFKRGPKPLTEQEKKFLKRRIYKMYLRTKNDDMNGRFTYHELLVKTLENYFILNGRWYLGPKHSLQWLRENDREVYELFELVLKSKGRMKAMKQLIKVTLQQ